MVKSWRVFIWGRDGLLWNRGPFWRNSWHSFILPCAWSYNATAVTHFQWTIVILSIHDNTEQFSFSMLKHRLCGAIQFVLTMLWRQSLPAPPFQPSLSPFLSQRETYFDNISSVTNFLLLKHFGPRALTETVENTPLYFLFLKNTTLLGLGSDLPSRTESIFNHYLFLLKTSLWKRDGICVIFPFSQGAH